MEKSRAHYSYVAKTTYTSITYTITYTSITHQKTMTVLWDLTHWLWFYLAILLHCADVITIVLSHLKLYTCK